MLAVPAPLVGFGGPSISDRYRLNGRCEPADVLENVIGDHLPLVILSTADGRDGGHHRCTRSLTARPGAIVAGAIVADAPG
jgi:hypothetical protein